MKIGDRVVLSVKSLVSLYHWARLSRNLSCTTFKQGAETTGIVVKPGLSRGGLYLRVHVDGEKEPRTFHPSLWEKANE